jgi:hypothetical protein
MKVTNDCDGRPPHNKLQPQQEYSGQSQTINQKNHKSNTMQFKDTKIKQMVKPHKVKLSLYRPWKPIRL